MAKEPNGSNIAENFSRVSKAHKRYRQTDRRYTDGFTTTYSEYERDVSSRSLKTELILIYQTVTITTTEYTHL